MLYLLNNEALQPVSFLDYSDIKGNEKKLENLLAANLGELYIEDGHLMPISQERQGQEEPDLCALDKSGNITIFELKKGVVPGDTTIQVMRYAQIIGLMTYDDLNRKYQEYAKDGQELATAHALAFQLDTPLPTDSFNKKQKLVLVGSALDNGLIETVDYWRAQNIDIDFLPYRFYKIDGNLYFEFFAKPHDYHLNPKNRKGVIFDTNRTYDNNAVWDMLRNEKVSAYGGARKYINSFRKGDYVLYYHIGYGIIAAGVIKTSKPLSLEANEEKYHKVELIKPVPQCNDDIRGISASDLKSLLGRNFYYASTEKKPYLSTDEAEKVISALREKYDS